MLRKVIIKNFRKHKDRVLDLTPGLNCIIGMSDQGKSAILGALRWCWDNKPDGFGFKTWKTKKSEPTFVISEFDDCTIHKERNETEHFYRVNNREDKYEAMRGNVPEEVTKLVNIAPYCFKTQHEPFFLLWDSPGEVSRKLNESAGLTIVDNILNLSKIKEKEAIKEVEKLEKEIQENENELENLSSLVNARKDINILWSISEDIEKLNSRIEELESLISNLSDLGEDIEEVNKISKLEGEINKIIKEIDDIDLLEKDIKELESLISNLVFTDKEMKDIEKLIIQEARIEEMLDYCSYINTSKEKIKELESLISSLSKYKEEIAMCNDKILMLELEYENKLKELGICPLCMKEI